MIEGARGGGGREDLADECTLQVLGNWINTKQEKRNFSPPPFLESESSKTTFFKQKREKTIFGLKKKQKNSYDPIWMRLNAYLLAFNG